MVTAQISAGTVSLFTADGTLYSAPYEAEAMRGVARQLGREACDRLEAARKLRHYAWMMDRRSEFPNRFSERARMGRLISEGRQHLEDYR